MNKNERQDLILSIIETENVSNQSVLVERLEGAGFSVTQASVSRDLDEMGITKSNGKYRLDGGAGLADMGPLAFSTAGENLIVGRCSSGLASAVTVRIDALRSPDIVGTIAGDDTIFIAVKGRSEQERVLKVLSSFFGTATVI